MGIVREGGLVTLSRMLPRGSGLRATTRVMLGVGIGVAILFGLSRYSHRTATASTPTLSPIVIESKTLIERDKALLMTTATERLDAFLDPLFSDFHDRVPAFSEWAFAWRTSYYLLRDEVIAVVALPFSHPFDPEKLLTTWDEYIASQFDQIVLQPSGGIPALRSAHERWVVDMRSITETVAVDTLRTVALLRAQTQTPPPREAAGITTEKIDILAKLSDTQGSSSIKGSTLRPIMTRLVVRPHIATAVTAAGSAIGTQGTAWGGGFQLVGTIASFFMVDYGINRITTALGGSEAALSGEMYHLLDLEHQEMRSTWLAEAEAQIDARLAQIRPLLDTDRTTPLPNFAPVYTTPETPRPVLGQ